MSEQVAVLEFETPHLTVSLDENFLKIDLKGSLKNDIVEALERKPILKETIGGLLGVFVPLRVHLTDISSVRVNEKGRVQVYLPHRRHVLIPLERGDSEKLVDKLNELVPLAKKKEWERILAKRRLTLQARQRKSKQDKRVGATSYTTLPWYFPTEQIDNLPQLKPRNKRKKLSRQG